MVRTNVLFVHFLQGAKLVVGISEVYRALAFDFLQVLVSHDARAAAPFTIVEW